MNNILNEFRKINDSPELYHQSLKTRTGKKVIGCVPMHVPEEIIHAAGMLPVTLNGSYAECTLAGKYLQPSICPFVRNNTDRLLAGELDYLDGVVFADICDALRILPDIWARHKQYPFQHSVQVSGKRNAAGTRFIYEEFAAFKKAVEIFSGSDISAEKLMHSIRIYNQNRRLLQELYLLRRQYPELLAPDVVAGIVASSMVMLKEEHNILLSKLLAEIKDNKSNVETPVKRIRLLLSGNLCGRVTEKMFNVINGLKAAVIDDDLYVGRRYFDRLVNENLPPVDGLLERYIRDVPCPTKHNQQQEWATYLVELAQTSQADAVISILVKYCEPHAFDYPFVKKRLVQAKIPEMLLEIDPSTTTEQIRTRIQGLMEMVQGM